MPGFGPGNSGFGGFGVGSAGQFGGGAGQGPGGGGGGWFGFGNSTPGQAGGFGNTGGHSLPGIAGGGRYSGGGFATRGSQATPTGGAGYAPGNTGPMGTGITGNALMNAILSNNFTTPFSLQDAISVVSPSLGQVAGLAGLGNVMSTGPGPAPASDSGIGASIPTFNQRQTLTPPRPATPQAPPANVAPKVYKRPQSAGVPGGYDYLSGAGNMHPLQIRAALAAFNGPFDYYRNVLGQDLIDERGSLKIGTEMLPSEWDYIRKQGVNVGNNELTKLADLLYT